MAGFKNTSATEPVIRRMNIKVLIDVWDWDAGNIDKQIDITHAVLNYTWTKTISSPMGGCTVTLTPLIIDDEDNIAHAFDTIKPMDVVIIEEFGQVKFTGYVKKLGTNGSIGGDGKPQRNVSLTATHIGGLLQETQVGFQVIAARIKSLEEKFGGFLGAFADMADKLSKKVEDGGVLIKDIVTLLKDEWFKLLDALGASTYKTFLERYIDFGSGMNGFNRNRVLPSDVSFFYGNIDTMSFWTEMQKLAEAPFNEFFFDEGNHDVFMESGTMTLGGKVCLIGRPTPFDHSIRGGTEYNYWKLMPLKTIPLQYLTRYDFNRSTDECYSVYLAVPNYTDFNQYDLTAMGYMEVDDSVLNKLLLRPLTMNLFYLTSSKKNETSAVDKIRDFETEMKNAAATLKSWYEHNIDFLSGNISMMVPGDEVTDDSIEEVYLGDKVEIEGLDGEFYVEGVSHTWTYGSTLVANLSVTRGYDYGQDKKIEFKDKIFTAGDFPTKKKGMV